MPHLNRRKFLISSISTALYTVSPSALICSKQMCSFFSATDAYADTHIDEILKNAPTARFWLDSDDVQDCLVCHGANDKKHVQKRTENKGYAHDKKYIKCQLCAQECIIADGERGRCRARLHLNGKLISLVYGRPVATHIDPIEKKPLNHFLPGAIAFSMGTSGCSLSCQFCQNWEISQMKPEDFELGYHPPETTITKAEASTSPVIAFTYNEPTIWTEYILDVARLARQKGIKTVVISCGIMQEAPLKELCEAVDAIKIDLKGFSNNFYEKVCGTKLNPVLRSIKQVAQSKAHLEIVNLVVPTLNDSDDMLKGLVNWVKNETGKDTAIHFTKFHPDYKMLHLPPTPVATLEKAYIMAKEAGLHYPYIGNVPGHKWAHTYCPGCNNVIISRNSMFMLENRIKNGKCPDCGTEIKGVWS